MLNLAKALYRDERGAEGLEKILIVAAVVLPLLGLLIWFREEIGKWAMDLWGTVSVSGQGGQFGSGQGGN
jgi:Flp pilus assembly pilin Flp